MGDAVDDELLHPFAVVGSPLEAGKALRTRWASIAQRITLDATYSSDPAVWPDVVGAIRSG